MIKITIYAFLIFYFIYTFWKINKDVHMFQQNSYRNERYVTWLNKNKAKAFNYKKIILPLIGGILIFLLGSIYGIIFWSVSYLVLFLFRKKETQIIKLKYTNRVKRLIVTISALFLIITALLIFIPSIMSYVQINICITLLVLTIMEILSPYIIMLSNIINTPIEKSRSRYYYNDAKKKISSMKELTVIGITGSYGKTSTKHVINKILSKKFNVLMTPENYNTTMGLIRTIREYLKPTHNVLIAEMGARNIGDIKEICDLVSPKYGVLTSVGPMHLETFKTIENIRKTKYELIESIPKDGIGFLSLDDENIKAIDKTAECKHIYYGISSNGLKYWAEDIKYTSKGSVFTVCKEDGTRAVFQTKLLGKLNIYNILSGAAIASEMGMDLNTISYAVRDLEQVEHRLELKKLSDTLTIIDDAYNSNPRGSRMALEVLSQMEGIRVLITPGMVELGDKEYEFNKAFGSFAADCCDYIVLVGNKQTIPIQDGLKEKNYAKEKYFIAKNFSEGFNHIKSTIKDKCIVLMENDLPDSYNE